MQDKEHVEALSPEQFCARYNVSRAFFYSELARGNLTAKKVGNLTRVPVEVARAWFNGKPDRQSLRKPQDNNAGRKNG